MYGMTRKVGTVGHGLQGKHGGAEGAADSAGGGC